MENFSHEGLFCLFKAPCMSDVMKITVVTDRKPADLYSFS